MRYLITFIIAGLLFTGISVDAVSVFSVQQGGTGTTTAPLGQLIYGGASATNPDGRAYQSVATTSVTAGTGVSFTAFTAIGNSPVTISASGSTGSVATSSTEVQGQIPYWTTSGATPAKLGTVATTSLSLSAFPVNGASTLGALIGGSNTTLTWWGLATTSQPSSSNVLTSNGAAGVYGTATSTLTATSPLTGSFIQLGSVGSLGCQTASGSQAGCLSSTDWSTFNNKQAAGFQIGTSSITQGQLAYISSTVPTTLTSVATGTVSAGTGISLDSSVRSVIGGALAITNTGVISASCSGGTTCSGTNPLSISSFSYPFPSNATTTALTFSNGLTVNSGLTLGTPLTVPNGGTASTSLGGILSGNGTSAIKSVVIGSGLSYDGTTLTSTAGTNYWTNSGTFTYLSTGTYLGVGTTTPDSLLTISSTTAATPAPLSNTLVHFVGPDGVPTRVSIDANNSASNFGSQIQFRRNNGTSASPAAPTVNQTLMSLGADGYGTTGYHAHSVANEEIAAAGTFSDTSAPTYFRWFTTAANSIGSTERLRLDSNGNLGLGSTTPWGLLSVNATTTASNAPQFVIGSSTETVFLVDSDYDTGLSTTSPFAKLSIQSRPGSTSWLFGVGTTSASGAGTSATSTLTVGIDSFGNFLAGLGGSQVAIGSTSPFARFSIDASATTSTRIPIFAIGSTSSQALIVTGRSFTGIGTTTPTALLAVNPLASLTTSAQFAVGSSSASSFIINNAGLTGVGTSTPWGQFAVNPIAGNHARPQLVVGSSTATSFLVANTGRVGFGTTSPFAKLSIQGTTAQTAYLFAVSSSTSANAGPSATSTTLWSIDSFGNFFGNLLQRVRFTLGSTSVQNAAFSIDTTATSTPGFDWFNIGSTSSGTLFKVSAAGFVQTGESDIGTGSSTSFALNWGAYKNKILYRTGFSATTISLIQATTSQYAGTSHVLTICNPGGTAGAITIKGCDWAGGTAYTQTTSANQCDAISMYVTQGTSTLASPSYRVFCAANTGFTQTGP